MDYLNEMFKSYMKMYANLTIINDEFETQSFFQEIKDTESIDKKYLFADNGLMKQGDILTINSKRWIVIQEDLSYHTTFSRFIVIEANNSINFVINESLYTTYGIIDTSSPSINNGGISILDGKIKLTVQKNDNTIKIKPNDRIIKFGMGWRVVTTTSEKNGLLYVYCELDTIFPGDDVNNEIPKGIARWTVEFDESYKELNLNNTNMLKPIIKKNGVVVTTGFTLYWESDDETVATVDQDGKLTVMTTGSANIKVGINDKSVDTSIRIDFVDHDIKEYMITPSERIVYKMYGSSTYEITKYLNGAVDDDSYSITAYGLDQDLYTLEVIDGKSFKLTSRGFSTTPLTIRCESNTDGNIIEEEFIMYVS